MEKILVTGANGQLGREIKKLRNSFEQVYEFTDVEKLDLRDPSAVKAFLEPGRFGYVINCAAYTDVDGAESEPEKAALLNREVVRHLREALEVHPGTRLIHISTDYIFEGNLPRPLREEDPAGPLCIYGKTKLEGEEVLRGHPSSIVIRTSWLYSVFGKNFVKGMINRMDQREEMGVVFDQVGTPTYAEDLAGTIMQIISDVESGRSEFHPGTYHYSNEGVCSWYDLAMEICRTLNCGSRIRPIESDAYPQAAKRPAYSVLSKEKIKRTYGVEVPYWRSSLEKCIRHLL